MMFREEQEVAHPGFLRGLGPLIRVTIFGGEKVDVGDPRRPFAARKGAE